MAQEITSTALFDALPEKVFPLYCGSKFSSQKWWGRWFGIPTPQACWIDKQRNRVCKSDLGNIIWEIRDFHPPHQLHLKAIHIDFDLGITSLRELITVSRYPLDDLDADHFRVGTKVTRLTVISANKPRLLTWVAVKLLHRYVFNEFAGLLHKKG